MTDRIPQANNSFDLGESKDFLAGSADSWEKDSVWYSSVKGTKSRKQNRREEPKAPDLRLFSPPYVSTAETTVDSGILIRHSRHIRRNLNSDLFYFKWGFWLNIGFSQKMNDVIETRGQLEALLSEQLWRSPIEISVLRLGISPGHISKKVALKVPLDLRIEFYLFLCNFAMGDASNHPRDVQGEYNSLSSDWRILIEANIIGVSVGTKEDYAVVKLRLRLSSQGTQTEHQQILQLMREITSLVSEEYMRIIASGIYYNETGELYEVFDRDPNILEE